MVGPGTTVSGTTLVGCRFCRSGRVTVPWGWWGEDSSGEKGGCLYFRGVWSLQSFQRKIQKFNFKAGPLYPKTKPLIWVSVREVKPGPVRRPPRPAGPVSSGDDPSRTGNWFQSRSHGVVGTCKSSSVPTTRYPGVGR